ncbi:MAG: tetratricopeptide repeat protein [Planctomycetota bacterium]|nr:tetratricopeptide repeat protein [Planctomycetota bacterium]
MRLFFQKLAFAVLMAISINLQAEEPTPVDTINQFLGSIEKDTSLDPVLKEEVVIAVKQLRDDPFSTDAAITEGLALMYPSFTQALELVGNDETEKAIEAFGKLVTHENKFLAAESKYFIARAYVYDENYEKALPVLREFENSFAKDSVQTGNALYLKGIALANTLENKEAVQVLTRFIDQYPNASERMRVGAWRQLQLVSSIKKDSLGDVFQRMDFSRRRLSLQKTDQETKIQQDHIVKMLNTMIKKAEDQEKKSNSKSDKPGEQQKPSQGSGQSEGKGKSKQGQGSKNADGFAKRTFGAGDASDWSKLRDRERDPAFNALKEKFPARYKELVEQYYKSFQGGGSK